MHCITKLEPEWNLAITVRQGECQIPREEREGSQREGRKGEFVNTLFTPKNIKDEFAGACYHEVGVSLTRSFACYCGIGPLCDCQTVGTYNVSFGPTNSLASELSVRANCYPFTTESDLTHPTQTSNVLVNLCHSYTFVCVCLLIAQTSFVVLLLPIFNVLSACCER